MIAFSGRDNIYPFPCMNPISITMQKLATDLQSETRVKLRLYDDSGDYVDTWKSPFRRPFPHKAQGRTSVPDAMVLSTFFIMMHID